MDPALLSLFITQVIPLILKEYENLRQKDDLTQAQLDALDAQIAGYGDFLKSPQWKPDPE